LSLIPKIKLRFNILGYAIKNNMLFLHWNCKIGEVQEKLLRKTLRRYLLQEFFVKPQIEISN